jgi:hypothetical protein
MISNLFIFWVDKELDTITDVVKDKIIQVVKQRHLIKSKNYSIS